MPLHPNQHAHLTGKSVGTALHQLVVQVENVLDQEETALGIFLDIITPPVTLCVPLLLNMGSTTPLYGGLDLPWRAVWLQQLLEDLSAAFR